MRRAALLAALVLPLSVLPAAALEVPYLSGRVNDYADMIPDAEEQQVEQKLAAFEQQTGIQIAVLTIESLEGEVLEDFSLRVAETWKLGQKDKDNGALLLVSEQDRKMRIEVGYGLEPELTDLESRVILDDVVTPYFRRGDFGTGIEQGVEAMMASVEGREITPAPGADAGGTEMNAGQKALFGLVFFVVIGVFSAIAVASHGCQSWFLYVFLMPFYAAFPSAIFPALGLGAVAAWIVLFPILKAVAVKRGWGMPRGRRSRGFWGPFLWGAGTGGGWSSGRGGGFGGGGFGGGGFSGGGGSFGGGGASGGW